MTSSTVVYGTFIVRRGTGRRLCEVAFGCEFCRNLAEKQPPCSCRSLAGDFARTLGNGATVIRAGEKILEVAS